MTVKTFTDEPCLQRENGVLRPESLRSTHVSQVEGGIGAGGLT